MFLRSPIYLEEKIEIKLSFFCFLSSFHNSAQMPFHCSIAQACPTLCDPMDCSMPDFFVLCHLLEFAQIHVHWVGDAIQLSHPLLSSSPPALNLSQPMRQVVASGGKKYWSFSFNISSSSEHPGLTSFRMDWLDLLAVQETLKSLLQHHSSKASILPCSAFFIVQLPPPVSLASPSHHDLCWQSNVSAF